MDTNVIRHHRDHVRSLRWLGPEKGVIHLTTAAIVNAILDLWAKHEGKPVWKLLADMTPKQLVRCPDFSYVTDRCGSISTARDRHAANASANPCFDF